MELLECVHGSFFDWGLWFWGVWVNLSVPGVFRNTEGAALLDEEGVVSSVDVGISFISPVFSPRVADNPVRSVLAIGSDAPTNNRHVVVDSSLGTGGDDTAAGKVVQSRGIDSAGDWTIVEDFLLDSLGVQGWNGTVAFQSVVIEKLRQIAAAVRVAFLAN